MRYRRLSYRYAMVVRSGQPRPFGELSETDRLRLLVEPRWRPDTDTYETVATVDFFIHLAGVDEDDFEVQSSRTPWSSRVDAGFPHVRRERSTRPRVSARAPSTSSCPCPHRSTPSGSTRATTGACLRITLPKRGTAR